MLIFRLGEMWKAVLLKETQVMDTKTDKFAMQYANIKNLMQF